MYEDFYLQHLKQSSVVNKEVTGICPFHKEEKGSFFANIENGLCYCHGCQFKGNAITFAKKMSIDLKTVPGYDPRYGHKTEKPQKSASNQVYIYHDSNNSPILKVTKTPDKKFWQHHRENNAWVKGGVDRERLIPYRLPELLTSNGKEVFVTEGEKDVDRLQLHGYIATCNPMGAGKWFDHYSAFLDYKDVVLIPDIDRPGLEHMDTVGGKLLKRNKMKSLRVVYLPSSTYSGYDISDYLDEHSTRDFDRLVHRSQMYVPEKYHFWFQTEDSRNTTKIKFNRVQFINFLEFAGFGRYKRGTDFVYVRVINNQVEEITKTMIKDFVKSYIQSLPLYVSDISKERILAALMSNTNILFSDNQLEYLEYIDFDIKQDTSSTAHFYYQNCIVKIAKEKISTMTYNDFDGKIWKSQIIKRDFDITDDYIKAEFFQFMKNVCNQTQDRIESFKTILGYLLHSYKDEGNTRAIIFMDERLSEDGEANGRSGKSLVGKALKHIKNVIRIDGKNFKFAKNFAFQQVSFDTDIINFDDISYEFNFEKLFSMITDDMQIEKKNKDEFTLSFQESPKFLISTNYVIRGSGASFEGRKFEFEFSDHYNHEHSPADDFKHLFFVNWTDSEWNLYDNLMMNCVKKYLNTGILSYKSVNLTEKKLIDQTCAEFRDFCDRMVKEFFETHPEEQYIEYEKNAFYHSFTEEYEDFKLKLRQRTFTRWLRRYCLFREYYKHERRSNGTDYFCFIRDRNAYELF